MLEKHLALRTSWQLDKEHLAIGLEPSVREDSEEPHRLSEVAAAAHRINEDGISDEVGAKPRVAAELLDECVDGGDGAGAGEAADEEVVRVGVGRGGAGWSNVVFLTL
uniref:Uncharacterized protein n=1 Tax=Ananas comosus var. bracteatus TaxID=296719 RepID=A0A6V7NRQ8_ANACO|nr:unnamed protein product [Ananas comosus var. bracteatus]